MADPGRDWPDPDKIIEKKSSFQQYFYIQKPLVNRYWTKSTIATDILRILGPDFGVKTKPRSGSYH